VRKKFSARPSSTLRTDQESRSQHLSPPGSPAGLTGGGASERRRPSHYTNHNPRSADPHQSACSLPRSIAPAARSAARCFRRRDALRRRCCSCASAAARCCRAARALLRRHVPHAQRGHADAPARGLAWRPSRLLRAVTAPMLTASPAPCVASRLRCVAMRSCCAAPPLPVPRRAFSHADERADGHLRGRKLLRHWRGGVYDCQRRGPVLRARHHQAQRQEEAAGGAGLLGAP
jgi:hypothetical protein